MSVWSGLENGLPTADNSPDELAPTEPAAVAVAEVRPVLRDGRKSGEAPDMRT